MFVHVKIELPNPSQTSICITKYDWMFGDTIKGKNHIQVIFTSDPLGIMKPILSFVCWAPFLQTTHHVSHHVKERAMCAGFIVQNRQASF